MAISWDAAAQSSGVNTGVTSFSWAQTCSGANRILFISAATLSVANASKVTGITFQGSAATLVFTDESTTNINSYLYRLIAPSTVSNGTVTVTLNVTTPFSADGASSSYTGVDQTTPISATGAIVNTNSGSTLTASITTGSANNWVVAGQSGGTTDTVINGVQRAFGGRSLLLDSNTAYATASAQTIGVNEVSGGQTISLGAVSIQPSASTDNPAFLINLMA